MSAHIAIKHVTKDVYDGLGRYCTVSEVVIQEPTKETPLSGDGGWFCVRWLATCTDTKAFPAYYPGGHNFEVEGVTFVQIPDDGGEPEFTRVIDWNGATGAMGEARNRRSGNAENIQQFHDHWA